MTSTTVGTLVNGYVNIVTPGADTFSLVNDDGATLLIDGEVAVNSDGANAETTGTPLILSAGMHLLQERYVNNAGGGANVVSYSGPDTNNAVIAIPTSALSSASARPGH